MKSHSLIVNKTARVYTLGQLSDQTENIWLVLHGYAMLAQYFIKKFDELDLSKNYVITPEGLSKFYQSGFNGKIGASWMTSEDRENEIHDYTQYLESVYQNFITSKEQNKKIILLGFSQGVSTLFRWANSHKHPYTKIIAWGGTIPKDVLENYHLQDQKIQIYYGDEDPLFTSDQIHSYFKLLEEYSIPYQAIEYHGGHNVSKSIINDLLI